MTFDQRIQKLLYNCEIEYPAGKFINHFLTYGAGLGLATSLLVYDFFQLNSFLIGLRIFIISELVVYGSLLVISNSKTANIEEILPEFLTLMSGNIRSGLTPDRALLLSARKEFGPLKREIDNAAKATISGTPFPDAFMNMTKNVESEVFSKTIRLIVEGVKSGGNLADLLENTALDIRRFGAIRKEVAATALMYELFMFAAAGIGAPLLYSVSNFLITIVSEMRGKISISTSASDYLPFVSSNSLVSPETVFWFSLVAISITAIFGSLTAGVISKGKESEGITFIPVIVVISLAVFFIGGIVLRMLLSGVAAV